MNDLTDVIVVVEEETAAQVGDKEPLVGQEQGPHGTHLHPTYIKQTVSQSINQSINQSIKQSIDLLIN